MLRKSCRLPGFPGERGFSLAEVLVGGLVLVVGLVAMSQFFASAVARVLDSDIRSVLHQVATRELENIRGLPYSDVGTTDGHPLGTLAAEEDRVVQNMTIHVHREVAYWTDATYSGPYPANYRRVTVTVSVRSRGGIEPVELTTNVAGGSDGGTLDVTVTELAGDPVEGALVAVTNNHLIPSVNIRSTALRTDVLGHLAVPGLVPDSTTSYVVAVSKSGYNSARTEPGVVVVDGLPYTVVQLTIDRLATMIVKVVDTNGDLVAGVNLAVIGPDSFNEAVSSTNSGVSLTDIRYSTDLEPYVVRLLGGQGYEPQEIKVVLDPGSTQTVTITVPPGGPSTTTTVGGTATTVSSTTTSLVASASLRVTVYKSGTSALIQGARVTLSTGQSQITNKGGWVFFDNLTAQSYGMTVTANNYLDYSGSVRVEGAATETVNLTAGRGGGGGF